MFARNHWPANKLNPTSHQNYKKKLFHTPSPLPRPYLVYAIELSEMVENGVHGVEHGDHLHGGEAAADLSEGHHVRKQDRHALEHLSKHRAYQ